MIKTNYIKLKPFKLKCPKCPYSKILYPNSDDMDIMFWGLFVKCPKCKCFLERGKINFWDKLFNPKLF